MALPNAVDMSNWGGELTDSEASAMKAAGIETVIVATGPGAYGQWSAQQARTVLAHGMTLEAYHYLEFGRNPEAWIKAGWDALAESAEKVARAWMNVEDPREIGTVDERIAFVDACYAVADSLYPSVGHCTGRWYHTQNKYLGNTDRWKSRQLWNAYYDEDSDIDGLPYGGWTRESVAIEQFGGTQYVAGQSVDINYVYKPAVQAGENAAMLEDILVSIYRVAGEETLPWATQVANAKYRLTQRLLVAAGIDDVVTSHVLAHPGATGSATLVPHTHPGSPAVAS